MTAIASMIKDIKNLNSEKADEVLMAIARMIAPDVEMDDYADFVMKIQELVTERMQRIQKKDNLEDPSFTVILGNIIETSLLLGIDIGLRHATVSDVYVLFYMDDEYGHMNVKGVYRTLSDLEVAFEQLNREIDEANMLRFNTTFAPQHLRDYASDTAEGVNTYESYFWIKTALGSPIQ